MFANARNVLITGGSFSIENTSNDPCQRGWRLLSRATASGAFHDSELQYDRPKCHPGTREAILRRLHDWLQDSNHFTAFMWMYGPAGAGKTAIVQTFAEKCYETGILAASFFFSRGAHDRNHERLLVTTLSYQLCTSIPQMRQYVGEAMDQDPMILNRSLEAQMEKLIVSPLNRIMQDEDAALSVNAHLKLIIIDGLDECSDGKTQQNVLNVLSTSLSRLKIPLLCLVASRPEHQIRLGFDSKELRSTTSRVALDDQYCADDDIRNVLIAKCQELREEHPYGASLPYIWPTKEELDELVRRASGQFIYLATITKYIQSPGHRPNDRLETVISLSSYKDEAPFAELDALYHQILSSVNNIDKVLEILAFLILHAQLQARIQLGIPHFIEKFFGYRPGDVRMLLTDMHSIVKFDREFQSLSFYHASLADFLLDQFRSQDFFLNAGRWHAHLARKWIHYLSRNNLTGYPWVFEIVLGHCIHSDATPELLDDLHSINLGANFSEFSTSDIFHFSLLGLWSEYLRWLECQCGLGVEKEYIYQDQCNNFNFNQGLELTLLRYPVEMRQSLAAAVTYKEFHERVYWAKDLLEILKPKGMHMNDIVAIDRRAQPPLIKNYWAAFRDTQFCESDYLLEPSQAGENYVNENKHTVLANKLVEFISQMANESLYLHHLSVPGDYYRWELKEAALLFFCSALRNASIDAALASRVEKCMDGLTAGPYAGTSFHSANTIMWMENAREVSMEYIKRVRALDIRSQISDKSGCA